MSDVLMFCDGVDDQGYGGYNAHPGDSNPFQRRVPFDEALRNPPQCARHDRPYLTIGGYRQSRVLGRFRETGVITGECSIGHGFGQSTWCYPHNWAGSASEARDDRCPHQGIAAWIERRHAA